MAEPARASRRRKARWSILVKLTVAFTVPTLALFSVFAVVASSVAARDLEAELGRRLSAIAASASTQIKGKYLVDLQPGDDRPGADDNLFYDYYEGARRKLSEVAKATDAARVIVFDRDFTARVDTTGDVGIRDKHFQAELDRAELARVFEHGELASGLLFQGTDGRTYKTGYAPVYAEAEKGSPIVLAVGVDAPATFFLRLDALRRSLVLYGLLLLCATVAVIALLDALYLDNARMIEFSPAAAETTPKNIARNNIIPFHGGAVRWYERHFPQERGD